MPALELLAHRGRTRIVLGLRDVIDDLSVVQSDWLSRRKVQVVEQFYDAVWIYGDSRVFNPVREYSFPPLIADKTRFTGYLDQSSRLNGAPVDDRRWAANGDSHPQRKTVACVVGGGSDGSRLIETFVDAVLPEIEAVVLTGPYIPRPDLAAIKLAASKLPNVQILEFSTEADWLIANVDRVVAMAGYNTVCSILSFGKPALLVPRITPRREQWIRAELFSKLKLVDVLSPDQLTPGSLTAWMMQGANGCHRARDLVDLNGLDRIVQLTAALLPANGGHMERNAPPATAPLAGNEVR
jgi:predicted glycosyltransferase